MEEMVKRYEKEPDIKVEAVLQESDNLYTAFRTAEAAGNNYLLYVGRNSGNGRCLERKT